MDTTNLRVTARRLNVEFDVTNQKALDEISKGLKSVGVSAESRTGAFMVMANLKLRHSGKLHRPLELKERMVTAIAFGRTIHAYNRAEGDFDAARLKDELNEVMKANKLSAESQTYLLSLEDEMVGIVDSFIRVREKEHAQPSVANAVLKRAEW